MVGQEKQPGAVKHALEELAKVSTQLHLLSGQDFRPSISYTDPTDMIYDAAISWLLYLRDIDG